MNNAAEKAWIALFGNILGWEIIAPPGQMLSHAYARMCQQHPYLTRLAVIVTLLHLEDRLHPRIDPFKVGLLAWARKLENVAP